MNKMECVNEICNQKQLLKINENNLKSATGKDKSKIEKCIQKEKNMLRDLESKVNSLH